MRFLRNIEFKNLLLDIVITLLAFRYIDISVFVESSLNWVVYFVVIIQSFAIFLLWSDESILDFVDDPDHPTFIERTKYKITSWLSHFSMFSWALVCFWIMIPIYHLRAVTGHDFKWAVRISVVVCIVSGFILMIRFMATDVEKKQIEDFNQEPQEGKSPVLRFFVNLYDFLIYKNIGNKTVRYWLAYVIVFAFLVYTETLFEMLAPGKTVSMYYILPAVFLSYFPMRMLLVIKPPFSFIELATALCAFGIFVYSLLF